MTTNLQGAPIDDAVFVTDKEAVEMVRENFIEWKCFLIVTLLLTFKGLFYFSDVLFTS